MYRKKRLCLQGAMKLASRRLFLSGRAVTQPTFLSGREAVTKKCRRKWKLKKITDCICVPSKYIDMTRQGSVSLHGVKTKTSMTKTTCFCDNIKSK